MGESSNRLASFAFNPGLELSPEKLRKSIKDFEKTFYWEKPAEKFSLVSFGELFSVSESGKGRFAATEKKIRPLYNNFVNNWSELKLSSVPLFLGGMKFTHENQTELWENYSDSNWFIPQVMVMEKENKSFMVYNFFFSNDSSLERLTKEFTNKTYPVFNTRECVDNNHTKPKVISVSGISPKDKKKWMETVKKAVQIINNDEVNKVVLSRMVEMNLDKEPDVDNLLSSLKKRYPECYLFAFHSGKSTFLGASPEKLIRITSGWVEADALAGSAPRGMDESEDKLIEEELLKSEKDLFEHNTVINYITGLLKHFSDEIHFEKSPKIKKLFNIQHLWTPVKAKLNSVQKVFTLLEGIHPTPAVCGFPQSEALNAIKKMEDYYRGMYAGVIGWFNLDGEGEFTVAIRSALLKGKKLYAFAGGGIVEASDPVVEYKETELKLKPILALFENEN